MFVSVFDCVCAYHYYSTLWATVNHRKDLDIFIIVEGPRATLGSGDGQPGATVTTPPHPGVQGGKPEPDDDSLSLIVAHLVLLRDCGELDLMCLFYYSI